MKMAITDFHCKGTARYYELNNLDKPAGWEQENN